MCGMMQKEDIAQAAFLGADAIGLIFAPQSPRALTIEKAKTLLNQFPLFLDAVAVLVDPCAAFVEQIIQELPVNLLQFHGEETPEFCNQFKIPYIKAIPVTSKEAILNAQANYEQAKALLLDTYSPKAKGGTGKPFDWNLIPDNLEKPFLLAGGLTSENVSEAVKRLNPYGVDVCSGIEQSPGIKNHQQMRQFVEALWGKK
jgi:phosphoribosylanthranilate isomerase